MVRHQWAMGLSMNRCFRIVSAGLLTVLLGATEAAADEYRGAYVARITHHDKQASDSYPPATAALMVWQDGVHSNKSHEADPADE